MIPKIIHQTWKTNIIPDKWIESQISCEKIHNNYVYMLWTHEKMKQFVNEFYPELLELYLSYKYDIQRCDVFRYLVLYKYGGIYLDLDIYCIKKLDDLLKYDIVITKCPNLNLFYTNSFFMIKQNHPFFKYCISKLLERSNKYIFFGKHFHIMASTGPHFLTSMINEYNINNIKNIYIMSNKDFAGDCNVCTDKNCKGGTYFKHVVGNSWHSMDSTIYNYILCNYLNIIGIILLLLFLIFIIIFRKTYKNKYYYKKIYK
jgi:mannosyltransferase OCH1-like enzyme